MKCSGCGDDVCEKCGICHAGMTDAKGDDCVSILKAMLDRSDSSREDLRVKWLAAKELLAREMGFKGESLEGGIIRAHERVEKLANSDEFRNKVKLDTERMIEGVYGDSGAARD